MAHVQLQSEGGRYPYQLAPYQPADIRAFLQIEGGRIRVRIDDLRNPDRWEELVGNLGEILAALLRDNRRPEGQP